MSSDASTGVESRCPITRATIRDLRRQRAKRVAWDDARYTQDEFVSWYGEKDSVRFWSEAPHYTALRNMIRETNFHCIQYFLSGGASVMTDIDIDLTGPPRIGNFAVLVPDLLLLLRVSHLQGKLKPSRLAPASEHWQHREQEAIVIDGAASRILVCDFREEVYSNEVLTRVGLHRLKRAACDFVNFLEDDNLRTPSGSLAENFFMDFLAVAPPEMSFL